MWSRYHGRVEGHVGVALDGTLLFPGHWAHGDGLLSGTWPSTFFGRGRFFWFANVYIVAGKDGATASCSFSVRWHSRVVATVFFNMVNARLVSFNV